MPLDYDQLAADYARHRRVHPGVVRGLLDGGHLAAGVRVLEVGCGTGLLLTRLAASCAQYVGVDFSATVLDQLSRYLARRPGLEHVSLQQAMAHELSFVADDSGDLGILNSVVQYFPDVDYLLQVLAEAVRVTAPGGHIFIGDVRSLPLLGAYHASVQLYKALDEMSLEELRRRTHQAQRNEKELALDPVLFEELGQRWDKIGRVHKRLKPGAYDNELSRFRYDVLLELGNKEALVEPPSWVSWDEAGEWRAALAQALTRAPDQSVGIRGLRDGRVAQATRLIDRILSEVR